MTIYPSPLMMPPLDLHNSKFKPRGEIHQGQKYAILECDWNFSNELYLSPPPFLFFCKQISFYCICLVGQIGANENNRTKTMLGAINKDYAQYVCAQCIYHTGGMKFATQISPLLNSFEYFDDVK